MTIKTLTLDELHATALGALRAYFDDAQTQPGSDYDVSARMVAAIGVLTQMQAQQLGNEIFVATASDDGVVRHADRFRLERSPAAQAIGKAMVTAASGTSVQGAGSVLTHGDGTTFTTTSPGTVALPAFTGKTCAADCAVGRLIVSPDLTNMAVDQIIQVGGHQRAIKQMISAISAIDLYEPLPSAPAAATAITAVRGCVVEFRADEVGADGNKLIGDSLTLASPATGVNATARIMECSGGGDEETIDELRARTIDHESGKPGGGNVEQVRQLARTTPTVRVADACVFPCFYGMGSMVVVPIGLAGARVVGQQVLDLVADRLEEELSAFADIHVQGITYTASEYDVDVTLTTEIGFERDFVSSGFTIAASPSSTVTRVYFTATPVGTIEVGDRVLVVVRSGGWWKTYQRTVTSVQASGGNFWIDLDGELPIAPASTDPVVLPGGPLAEAALAAIETLFDGLGPSRKNTSPAYTFERHPLPSQAWDDTLRPASLTEALTAIDGVTDLTLTTPATNQQPGALETIRRGKILLRFQEA